VFAHALLAQAQTTAQSFANSDRLTPMLQLMGVLVSHGGWRVEVGGGCVDDGDGESRDNEDDNDDCNVSAHMLARVRPCRMPYSLRGMHEFCEEAIRIIAGLRLNSSSKSYLEGCYSVLVALPVFGNRRTHLRQLDSRVPCNSSGMSSSSSITHRIPIAQSRYW
jgi:hypothetical protein